MDVLTDVLRALRLRGTAYFQADFVAPWGMRFSGSEVANFHLVVEGRCFARHGDEHTSVELQEGDLVVYPHGSPHRLTHPPQAEAPPAKDFIADTQRHEEGRLVYGSSAGERTTLICGHFERDRTAPHPLWDALPPVIHLSNPKRSGWYETAAKMTVAEAREPAGGSEAVIDRLAEILLIQVIRDYAETPEGQRGFLLALKDGALAEAVKSIHAKPAHPWTVNELAKMAGMSRSGFSAQFQQALGTSPMQYVTLWRMHRARELVQTTDLHFSDVAQQVGYESEWAFAKAFSRTFGEGPGATRRRSA